jgi:small subunit ribosomal protein S9
MADEPQTPEQPQRSAEEEAALAEQHAVPTEEATEIAGSVEDAALEAFEEAQDAGGAPAEETVVAETAVEEPAAEEAAAAQPAAAAPVASEADAGAESAAPDEPVAEAQEPAVAQADGEEPSAGDAATQEPAAEEASAEEAAAEEDQDLEEDEEEPAPRVKPAVPGAHLEVDIVPEGVDPLGRDVVADPYAIEDEETVAEEGQEVEEEILAEPISTAAIDLAAGARYRATGKRKTAIARVILRPGSGEYKINGRSLDEYFPRATLQRNIRQPLETVGYQERMDVVARLHGGGVSAQAGALRHGVSRALLEADPNLRGELKRRGFLTRDSRAKERKKAGLKKARKRPQFSKR